MPTEVSNDMPNDMPHYLPNEKLDGESRCLLIVEDDPEDRLLLGGAFRKAGIDAQIWWVRDGEEMDDYLHGRNQYGGEPPPRPSLILMDLNMPKVNGLEATARIKSDPHLWQIPVVIFTTSAAPEDVQRAYTAGANSYITKPSEFNSLLKFACVFTQYWIEIVTLPVASRQCST